jgi:hypothetical protein
MATVPDNMLQTVTTYQNATIAWLLNQNVAMDLANRKFMDFQNRTGNLGDAISWNIGSQAITQNSLVITPSPVILEKATVITANAISSAYAFDEKEFIYNVSDYMEFFGKERAMEIGANIEANILEHITGTARYKDGQNPLNGQIIDTTSGPYRFYGNGIDEINSFTKLSTIISNFQDYGAAKTDLIGIIPLTKKDTIIGSGLDQFALNRNNEIAETWDLGTVSGCRWTNSNLLPIHRAGTIGDNQIPLTLVSTNDPTGQNITQLTFSSAAGNDVNAVKAGDLLEFTVPTLRYLTYTGHHTSAQAVQVRITSDATSVAGAITVDIFPALVSVPVAKQNLNMSLVAGMTAFIPASHIAGVVWSGNPFYLAMPKLSNQEPFPTVAKMDSETGVALRNYWGTKFGENFRGYVTDAIYGAYLVAKNSMRVLFPLPS